MPWVCVCGIKGLEMSGTEQDWKLLKEKFSKLRKLLSPIESTLQIAPYFNMVEKIYDNLLKTYLGQNMDDWWSKILIDCKKPDISGCLLSPIQVDALNGWITHFCNGTEYPLSVNKLKNGEYKDLSCLSSCPMKIVDRNRNIQDDSTLIAGILGFKIHTDTLNGVPSLEPAHGWTMLLSVHSRLLREEKKIPQISQSSRTSDTTLLALIRDNEKKITVQEKVHQNYDSDSDNENTPLLGHYQNN